jgi:hypothetical protein
LLDSFDSRRNSIREVGVGSIHRITSHLADESIEVAVIARRQSLESVFSNTISVRIVILHVQSPFTSHIHLRPKPPRHLTSTSPHLRSVIFGPATDIQVTRIALSTVNTFYN